MNTDKHAKEIWSALIRRRGGPDAHAGLWDQCPDAQRATALAGVTLMEGEEPVFVSSVAKTPMLVLTTRRLIQGATEVPIETVVDVGQVGLPTVRKDQLTVLRITTLEHQTIEVTAEPGAPYAGLWNVLLHIAKKNRSAQTRAS